MTQRTKQPNSSMCFVCGVDNPFGLKLAFYEDDDGRVWCEFTPAEVFQGYPDRLHGGIVAAVLDEALGRTVIGRGIWAVTARMSLRYHRPTPLGEKLVAMGELVQQRKRIVEARGELRLPDGQVAVEASATYVVLPEEGAAEMEEALRLWRVIPD
jgi:uncharacterized protein (TIGR00369 family)